MLILIINRDQTTWRDLIESRLLQIQLDPKVGSNGVVRIGKNFLKLDRKM